MIIKIVKTPQGAAPLMVRRQWIGIILNAHQVPEDFKEIDFLELAKLEREIREKLINMEEVTREEYESFKKRARESIEENRGGCMALVRVALTQLEQQKRPEAVDWFRRNWLDKGGWFLFGPDEYVVLQQEELN